MTIWKRGWYSPNKVNSIGSNGQIELDYLRICAEFIFRGTHIKNVTGKNRIETYRATNRNEGQQTEKIIINADGKQYADILRAIKSNVNI